MLGSLIFEQVTAILNWPFGAAMAFVLLVITLAMTMGLNTLLAGRFAAKGVLRAR
jgi:putative spermidine/putrescine transport system permease protein